MFKSVQFYKKLKSILKYFHFFALFSMHIKLVQFLKKLKSILKSFSLLHFKILRNLQNILLFSWSTWQHRVIIIASIIFLCSDCHFHPCWIINTVPQEIIELRTEIFCIQFFILLHLNPEGSAKYFVIFLRYLSTSVFYDCFDSFSSLWL